MNTIHPYRLRPYHNPERVDESKVPPGWRFRYADEIKKPAQRARHFASVMRWIPSITYGLGTEITYIVPVEA